MYVSATQQHNIGILASATPDQTKPAFASKTCKLSPDDCGMRSILSIGDPQKSSLPACCLCSPVNTFISFPPANKTEHLFLSRTPTSMYTVYVYTVTGNMIAVPKLSITLLILSEPHSLLFYSGMFSISKNEAMLMLRKCIWNLEHPINTKRISNKNILRFAETDNKIIIWPSDVIFQFKWFTSSVLTFLIIYSKIGREWHKKWFLGIYDNYA